MCAVLTATAIKCGNVEVNGEECLHPPWQAPVVSIFISNNESSPGISRARIDRLEGILIAGAVKRNFLSLD